MLFSLPPCDVVARAAVVEGYNTNTYQTQDDPSVPIVRRHPSPFTGVDVDFELRFPGRDADLTTVRAAGRVNHYEPLDGSYQSDDGAANAGFSWRRAVSPRTVLSASAAGTISTLNGAHLTDGTIFQFDPSQLRRTYWLVDGGFAAVHDLSSTWRLRQSFGATTSGTIDEPPTRLPDGTLADHRGLDYVMPYAETDLERDFTERSRGDLMVLYQYAYQLYVLDFSQQPPRNVGPDKMAFLTLLVGYTRHFTPELSSVTRVGGVLASAPPRDPDQRPILAPSAEQELYWTRPLFGAVASAAYTWGTVNPRLGSGPTATANALAVGTPYPRGKWKDLALVGRAQLSWSSLLTGESASTSLALYAAGAEVRYAVGSWLGVLAGYDFRYASIDSPAWQPPFVQHVFYVGLGGWWSTDRAQPPLTTFTAPVKPPA